MRRDLLDTYDGRIRSTLAALDETHRLGFASSRAESGALLLGYWGILGPTYRAQRGDRAWRATTRSFEALAVAARTGDGVAGALKRVESRLEGFRAAPLTEEETLRRAGQLDRFIRLVAIEYGRGVSDGRVDEGLRDPGGDHVPRRRRRGVRGPRAAPPRARPGRDASRRAALASLGGSAPDREPRREAGRSRTTLEATVGSAVDELSALYPTEWKDAAKTADFDVIAAALDRMQGAAAAGDWGAAESARIEAYGIFELGPEQRLRGLAPSLFQGVESLFWYGTGDQNGLVRLIKAKASSAELAAAREALDAELAAAEERIGNGPGSRVSIVSNSAVIVFREGLEAVLDPGRAHGEHGRCAAPLPEAAARRRPPRARRVRCHLGRRADRARLARALRRAARGDRLARRDRRVAPDPQLVLPPGLLAGAPRRAARAKKRTLLAGRGLSLAAAQVAGLVLLGFTSVYREGFETVLFLQALTLEAGAWTVLQGVAVGFAAVVGVFFLVVALERKLPHKKMLIATGLMITWVLVVLVGQTVQTMQKVGWVPVTPVEGLELPYWSGVWLGVYPTWEGLLAQAAALAFVLGSYVAAETVRNRRRARILAAPIGIQRQDTPA